MPYATYRLNKIIAAETIRFIVTVAIVVYKGFKLVVYRMLTDKDKEKEFIEDKIITENELMEYKKIYKYCPSFHDVRI